MIPTNRIDELLAPDYTAGLDGRSLDELKAMGSECHAVETAVSYYRRLAQGRIEILDAWAARAGDDTSVEALVADLPRILGAEPGRAPATTSRYADAAPEIEAVDFGGREQLVADDTLANLVTLSPDELGSSLQELRKFERDLSTTRRKLHGVIDALEREIATRQAADAVG